MRPLRELKAFKKLLILSGEAKSVEFNVGYEDLGYYTSHGEYTIEKGKIETLYKANHTDELESNHKVYLRVDYKVSGIGSNSCGPALLDQFKLNEKDISFTYYISPIK